MTVDQAVGRADIPVDDPTILIAQFPDLDAAQIRMHRHTVRPCPHVGRVILPHPEPMKNTAPDGPEPELPTEADYDEGGLPTLLGLYDGVPLTERDDAWSVVLPDRILIFKGPLERWCANREELTAEIGVTVIHEIAHHFGIDDDRLHELGWE